MTEERPGKWKKVRSFVLNRGGHTVAKLYHRDWDDQWEAYSFDGGVIGYRGTFATLEQAQEQCQSAR